MIFQKAAENDRNQAAEHKTLFLDQRLPKKKTSDVVYIYFLSAGACMTRLSPRANRSSPAAREISEHNAFIGCHLLPPTSSHKLYYFHPSLNGHHALASVCYMHGAVFFSARAHAIFCLVHLINGKTLSSVKKSLLQKMDEYLFLSKN